MTRILVLAAVVGLVLLLRRREPIETSLWTGTAWRDWERVDSV